MTNLLPEPSGPLKITNEEVVPGSRLKLSLILPTYNERENIVRVIQKITWCLDQILPKDYELIVVDDNSPDGTWQVAQQQSLRYSSIRVMRREGKRSLSLAVIRGWQVARGEVLGVIDADLQHPPEIIPRLWKQIEKGKHFVIASRHFEEGGVSDWKFERRLLSRGAQVLGLLVLPGIVGRVSDPMSGFFLVRRDLLAGKILNPIGYKISLEVLARCQPKLIAEVGYVFWERKVGGSKVTWKQYLEYIQHLISLRLSLWSVKRFLRFCLVGLSGVFVDLVIFYFLREKIRLGLTSSAIVASQIAIMNNFLWNDRWTFGDISCHQQEWHERWKRFFSFNLVSFSGLILNVITLNLLVNRPGVNEYVAKLGASIAVAVWNFWFNLKLSWKVKRTK